MLGRLASSPLGDIGPFSLSPGPVFHLSRSLSDPSHFLNSLIRIQNYLNTLQLFLLKAVALPVLLPIKSGRISSKSIPLLDHMGPAFRAYLGCRIPSSVLLSVYAWAEQGNEFSSMVWPTSTGYHTRPGRRVRWSKPFAKEKADAIHRKEKVSLMRKVERLSRN
jgi:hypothetical protein